MQGQQVQPLWEPLLSNGVFINFAHRSFMWRTDSSDPAAVHVVIVGFSYEERSQKQLFVYEGHELSHVDSPSHINGYLLDAPDVFVARRTQPISGLPAMIRGNQPTDGGNLIFTRAERKAFLAQEPTADRWIRPFSMGADFIKGQTRYCLWLVEATPQILKSMPAVMERVLAVKHMREQSSKVATQKKAATPWLFDEIRYSGDGTYIGVPVVSSERRKYIPMGFVENGMIPGNKLFFVPTDSRFVFGILMSRVHNAWMRSVAGRLKSDYSYANTIVYNNLVIPDFTEAQRASIEAAAQAVIDARQPYLADGATLADLYDPDNDWLYPELTAAHTALDAAVEQAYGFEPGCEESAIVERLFQLYSQATAT